MLGSIIYINYPASRRSSIGDRAFVVAAVLAWNKLPNTSDPPHRFLFSDTG